MPRCYNSLLHSPQELKVLNWNPDTFLVNFKLVGPDGKPNGTPLPDHIADQLDEWQKLARKAHDPIPTPLTFVYRTGNDTYQQTLLMREHGSSPWSWLLYSDDIRVAFSYGTLKGNVFCQVRFSSHLLHTLGAEQAIVAVESMLHEFMGELFHQQASEIHLCVDMQGFDFSTLCIHHRDAFPFVSRVTNISDRPLPPTEEEQEGGLSPQDLQLVKQKLEEGKAALEQEEHLLQPSLRTTHRRVATFDFGSHASEISAQIYNKSLEIKKHRKEWFEPIWLANGWDGESEVWRIEFRFKRKFLNKFDLNEAFTVLQQCALLWQYATEEWLRFVDLSQSQDSNTSRLPTHDVWQLVQQAYQLTHSDTNKTPTLDPAAEREARLSHLVQTQPLQVIKQGSTLVLNEELLSLYQYTPDDLAQLVGWLPPLHTIFQARLWLAFLVDALELPDFLRLTRLRDNNAALQATLDTDDTYLDPVTLRSLAREQLQQMTDAQRDQLLAALSPSTYTEVQTALVKRSKRLAKLDAIIASLAGFMRSAVALAPLDEIGEVSSLTGQRVRQPDLYSDMLWLLDKVREYDEKKQRSHPEEVWKKRLLYGFKTAAELEEERRLYGVDLAPQDWTSLDLALHDLRSVSSSRKQQPRNNHDNPNNDDLTEIA